MVIVFSVASLATISFETTFSPGAAPPVKLIVYYTVIGGAPLPTAPTFRYNESDHSREVSLSLTPTPVNVDYGSRWSVDSVPGSSFLDRWSVAPENSTGVATENKTIIFQYSHEYQISVFYDVKPSGNIPVQPTITLSQGGQKNLITLTNQSSSSWADDGTTWSVDSTLSGPNSLERWWTDNNTGAIAGPSAVNVTYLHQFLLIMQVSGSGSTLPSTEGENWETAGSVVPIQANPTNDSAFQNWECTGKGCYPGQQSLYQITMLGPITETAHFSALVSITIQTQGSDAIQYVIVDNKGPFALPYTFTSAPNSTHTLEPFSNSTCGPTILSMNTCAEEFKGWTGEGSVSGNGFVVIADGNKTITAAWSKSYLNPLEFIAGYVALIIIFAIILIWRRGKLKRGPIATPRGPSGLACRVGLLSDLGRNRSNNEDSVMTMELLTTVASRSDSVVLGAVADGVGGSQKGEVASKLALKTLASELPQLLLESEGRDRSSLLRSCIESANDEIVKHGIGHRESEGLATTLVASLIEGSTGYVANVGDSRAYLVNRGGIKPLTKDHSQVQELVEAGRLTQEQARHYAGRNVITRAVGAATDVNVDTFTLSLAPGDRIVLCTDGLWEPVTDEEIQRIVLQSPEPQAACEKLVAIANERGGKDNISLVIVELKGPTETTKR